MDASETMQKSVPSLYRPTVSNVRCAADGLLSGRYALIYHQSKSEDRTAAVVS